MSHSPYAKLRPVPVDAVTLTDRFWSPRLEINRTVTLPSQYRQCEETGRIDNFRRVSGKVDKPFVGIFFNDSDIYKWLEAASWALASGTEDTALQQMVDDTIAEVAAAQHPDGYLNSYFSLERADERWTNLRDMHELYCAGHLFQAAVAHFRATGERTLLEVATRFADCICAYLGPTADGKHVGTGGHEEIEMGLVELYRVTDERRYLDQAQYFIDARGANPSALIKQGAGGEFNRGYFQDSVPFRDLGETIGHAVRMIYLTCGATDVYAETGEAALKTALDRQWDNMTGRRMYVTGGLGARHEGEAFGKDYELPSDRAYAETCAAIANVMWNWRVLNVTGDAKYADLMELALYNGVLSGLSLEGTEYFYVNPLEDDGTHRRQPWFGCACCPPNVARLMASLPGYFYGSAGNDAAIHLYASGTAEIALQSGEHLTLTQMSNYPWDGEIEITLNEVPASFQALLLRIPGWADNAALTVNGEPIKAEVRSGSYARIRREWQAGDKVRLSLPMPVRALAGHPQIASTRACVALMRGPLVYCIEQAGNFEVDVREVVVPGDASFRAQFQPDLLGGVTTVQFIGLQTDASHWRSLYRPVETLPEPGKEKCSVTAIPYYAWANRAPGPMRVWIPVG
jgi:hypothetical protein